MLDAIMKADLSSPLKGTLLALAYHENREGQWVWPKIETLAGESGLNRKTVVKSLAELITLGLVKRESRSGVSSQYQLQTQPIFGLTQFRADPNTVQVVTQKRADTQPKYGLLTSPGDPSKNGSNPATLSAWRAEACRLLEATTKDNRPHFVDLGLLQEAANGNKQSWLRFKNSHETSTCRFRATNQPSSQESA